MAASTAMSRDEVDGPTLDVIAAACGVPSDRIEDVYACTPLQIATMAESAIRTGAAVFQFILSLAESMDLDRFSAALQQVVAVNAVLRTRLADCGSGLVQVVVSGPHHTQRLSGDPTKYLSEDKAQPMALGASLLRSALIDRKLVLTMHHAIMDHTALTPIFQDVLRIYHGEAPETRAPFKDFVKHCRAIDDVAAKAFWAARFKGHPAIFPKVEQDSVPNATQKELRTIKLEELGSKVPRAHLPAYIEAAWALTARVFTGSDSVAYGVVLSGRTSTLDNAETTLGPTITTIPMQANIQRAMTIEGLVKDRSTAIRQLQTHPALQYGTVGIRSVSDAASIASHFQTLLNIRPNYYESSETSEIKFEYMDEPHGAFGLCLSCNIMDDGIFVEAMSDPSILCESQLRRTVNQFEHILKTIMAGSPQGKISQLQLLNNQDQSEILEWNAVVPPSNERCIHEMFTAQAKEQPSVGAVDAHDGSATYRELDELSDRLAGELMKRSVSLGDAVAFVFEKSLWTVVAILGILKAGGACVPLEVSDPPARKAGLISSAKVKVVLASKSQFSASSSLAPCVIAVNAEAIAGFSAAAPARSSPDDLAYILFTSGSTGTPKGVMLEHRCLASTLDALSRRFGWASGDRTLQFASHVWDTSLGEIFSTLLSGGCLCIPSEEARQSNLTNFINSSQVQRAWLTPTVMRTLSPQNIPTLKTLLSIGEPISPSAASTWGGALRLINGWGPCEASILSATAELTPSAPYPESIGTPLGCALWVVHPANVHELAPIGAVGELVIEGPGVARGYLNDKAKSMAAFVPPPNWTPTREKKARHFYRTGDLAKYYPDGSICFIGRKDNQVKIRGQRFELGELEAILSNCNELNDVCATTKIQGGRTELVAIICLSNAKLRQETALQDVSLADPVLVRQCLRAVREYARAKLPSYMVPTIWFAIEKMPRTASAKLDRWSISNWLKTQDLVAARSALDAEAHNPARSPITEEEKMLTSLSSAVLGIEEGEIGRESSFLQLGGDSVLAMQVASRGRRDGLLISTAELLRSKPIADIAKSAVIDSTDDEAPPVVRKNKRRTAPPASAILGALKARDARLRIERSIHSEDFESIVPATDTQATMLALGPPGSKSYHVNFTLTFSPSIDAARLRKACEEVVRHHEILRTQFVQLGSTLYQVVIKNLSGIVSERETSTPAASIHESRLCCFHLNSDGQRCQSLCIEIHHVLYDAISLGLLIQDLRAAYMGESLSDGPSFASWVSHVQGVDESASRAYWESALQGSSMTSLVPSAKGQLGGHTLDDNISIRIPLRNLQSTGGTASSMMKAAWALLLASALNTTDVVFGEVSANRYLSWPGVDQVRGPCVNHVPVRVRFDEQMSLASLVSQIQEQHLSSMPHHHLGIRSIIQNCTSWPRWTRFSSALVYQNHGSLGGLKLGDSDCTISHRGALGDSADIWVIATPEDENLHVELRYSSDVVSSEQIQWIEKNLTRILEALPSTLEQSLDVVKDATSGGYPPSRHTSPTSIRLNQPPRSPTTQAQTLVSQAWKEVALVSNDKDGDSSMFTCGADLVTALLLSEYYRRHGYELSADAITRHPTRLMQASLLDSLLGGYEVPDEKPLGSSIAEAQDSLVLVEA